MPYKFLEPKAEKPGESLVPPKKNSVKTFFFKFSLFSSRNGDTPTRKRTRYESDRIRQEESEKRKEEIKQHQVNILERFRKI